MAGIDSLKDYSDINDLLDCIEFFNVDIDRAPFVNDFYLTLSKLAKKKADSIQKSFYELKKKQAKLKR